MLPTLRLKKMDAFVIGYTLALAIMVVIIR
jgi:hypothetical protein